MRHTITSTVRCEMYWLHTITSTVRCEMVWDVLTTHYHQYSTVWDGVRCTDYTQSPVQYGVRCTDYTLSPVQTTIWYTQSPVQYGVRCTDYTLSPVQTTIWYTQSPVQYGVRCTVHWWLQWLLITITNYGILVIVNGPYYLIFAPWRGELSYGQSFLCIRNRHCGTHSKGKDTHRKDRHLLGNPEKYNNTHSQASYTSLMKDANQLVKHESRDLLYKQLIRANIITDNTTRSKFDKMSIELRPKDISGRSHTKRLWGRASRIQLINEFSYYHC